MSTSRPSRSCKLHALEARSPRSNKFLDSNYAQLERQLSVHLGPRSSQEDLRHFSSFYQWHDNSTSPLGGGTLSPHVSPKTPRQAFSFGLCDVIGTVARLGARHTHPPRCRGKDHMSSQRCLDQAPASSRPSATNSSLMRGMSTRYIVFTSSFFQVVNIYVEKSWF
jgi:hypothetical protein